MHLNKLLIETGINSAIIKDRQKLKRKSNSVNMLAEPAQTPQQDYRSTEILETIKPKTPAQSRVNQSSLLRILSTQISSICKDRHSTTSLGKTFQHMTTLTVKKLMFKWNFLCFNLCWLHLVHSLGTMGRRVQIHLYHPANDDPLCLTVQSTLNLSHHSLSSIYFISWSIRKLRETAESMTKGKVKTIHCSLLIL